jgi:hypothetical protein
MFDLTNGWNDENEATWCKEVFAEEVVNERLRSSGVTGADFGVLEREMAPTVDGGLGDNIPFRTWGVSLVGEGARMGGVGLALTVSYLLE